MNDRTLREYIPVMQIVDGCVVSKRGDLTFGWRVYLPVAYTVNEPGYDSIIASFMQAYRLLPTWCIVHKQDIFKNDVYHAGSVGEFLGDAYERHFEGRTYLNGYCYVYLTFSSKNVIEAKSGSSGAFSSLAARPKPADKIRNAAAVASQFEAVLRNNSLLHVVPLTDGDFLRMGPDGEDLGLIPDYLRLFSDTKSLEYPLEFEPDCVIVGDMVAKCWYVQDSDSYPGMVNSVCPVGSMSSANSKVYLSGGSPIGYQLKIPHVVNRYVVTLPRKSVESELNQRMKLMNSFSLYSSECRVNAEDLSGYLLESARDSATTIKCFTSVMAWGRPEEVRDMRNAVVTAFSELDMTVCEETRICPTLHYAAIPGAAGELGYDFYMTSEMTAFLCHGLWDGYDFGMRGGAVKVSDRRRMIPVTIDVQAVARSLGYVDNMNSIVVGPSGTGKSFTMNTLVRNWYNAGQHIFIIDVGDSYQGLCRVISEETGGRDGVYNTYDPEHPFSFNPFKGRKHWNEVDEDGERTGSGMEFVLSLIRTIYEPAEGWTKDATAVLTSLLGEFFRIWDEGYDETLRDRLLEAYVNSKRKRAKENGKPFDESKAHRGWMNPLPEVFPDGRAGRDPLFDSFFRYVTLVVSPLVNDDNYYIDNVRLRMDMFDMDKFGVALGKYKLGGEYGFLLNAETEADLFASRLTVFEVDTIKDNDDLFPLWTLCILHSFEEKMRSVPCQKVMVIEEAWSAIAKPAMANFIVWMWRTARKFMTSAVVVTQSLSDLVSSEIVKDAIIQNSSVKILLDQRKNANNFEKSAEILGLSPKDIGLVLSVGRDLSPAHIYKEAFFGIGESYGNVFGIEVSLEEALTYESDKVRKKPLFDLARETGSFIEAVKTMAARIRESQKKR
ncbi:MAG: TraG family conjugative transposon ATPase [Bacteroidales bacterium]|nr:TraG family conjugative transposon ATPase [Bacteroidales bacterium]